MVSVNDQQRAADRPIKGQGFVPTFFQALREVVRVVRRDKNFRRCFQSPGNPVFDLLCGMRLREDPGVEELQKSAIVLAQVVATVLGPPLPCVETDIKAMQRSLLQYFPPTTAC